MVIYSSKEKQTREAPGVTALAEEESKFSNRAARPRYGGRQRDGLREERPAAELRSDGGGAGRLRSRDGPWLRFAFPEISICGAVNLIETLSPLLWNT